MIEQDPPDILVTDCQMPRLNGFGLTERVRENESTCHIPVLMLTAKGFELSAEELAQRWNIVAVIAKPFSPRELLKTVEETLAVGT